MRGMKPIRPPTTHLKSRGEAASMRHRRFIAAHDGIRQPLQQAVHDGLQRRPSQHWRRAPCRVAGSKLVCVLLTTTECWGLVGDVASHATMAGQEQGPLCDCHRTSHDSALGMPP